MKKRKKGRDVGEKKEERGGRDGVERGSERKRKRGIRLRERKEKMTRGGREWEGKRGMEEERDAVRKEEEEIEGEAVSQTQEEAWLIFVHLSDFCSSSIKSVRFLLDLGGGTGLSGRSLTPVSVVTNSVSLRKAFSRVTVNSVMFCVQQQIRGVF